MHPGYKNGKWVAYNFLFFAISWEAIGQSGDYLYESLFQSL